MKYYPDLKIYISIQRTTRGIYLPKKKIVQIHLIVVGSFRNFLPIDSSRAIVPSSQWGLEVGFFTDKVNLCLKNPLFPG